jgi:hypothetical protein
MVTERPHPKSESQNSPSAKQHVVLIVSKRAAAAGREERVRLQYSSAPEIARFHPCPKMRKRSPEIQAASKLQCRIVSGVTAEREVAQSPAE